ncbi:MAG: dioxygenase [Candidatus Binataceae bacterium]|nr:dioxygenase [Candidatus Binataceae bacterium]
MEPLPIVFVSHGSPSLAIEPSPARDFLEQLGGELGQPEAIVCISAHWASAAPAVSGAARPATIHDFYGFPEELYQLSYPAPGAPQIAKRVMDLIRGAGFESGLDSARGLDHGAWSPLRLMYPDALIPVIQVSLQPQLGPAHHFALGQALAALRAEGILVLGSGGATHNLGQIRGRENLPAPQWVSAFADWLTAAIVEGRSGDLINYRSRAPYAAQNHPSEEHLLPLMVAAGAAGVGARGRCLHASYTYGVLSMASYAFGT